MDIHPRLLRADVDNQSHGRPVPSEKHREREGRIIGMARMLMARYSRDTVTMKKLGLALRMAPATIRFHFIDIDSILAEILARHLTAISSAMGKIPHDAPNRRALQRAAYVEATRTEWGGFTESHLLLIRERHTLPEDLAKPIEQMRQMIGEALGGEDSSLALSLLDTPELPIARIETILAQGQAKPPPALVHQSAAPAPPKTPANHHHHYKDWKAAKREKSRLAQAARAVHAPDSS